MISWLPKVCNELHAEMVTIYWLMLVPLVVFLVVLELFKTADKQPDAAKVLTRAVISIILLVSFKETINLIAFIGDGIADRIDGLTNMNDLVDTLFKGFSRDAPALYKIREFFIFALNIISYFLAYFGIFIADAMIHFAWSVLYVCAPLMILCHVSESTASVCKNLYKGLLTVITWKILWSVLSVLLLKLATEQTSANSDNAITTAVINLSIGLAILFIPFFSKSLIGDGVSSFSSGIAAAAGGTALKAGQTVLKSASKRAISRGTNSISDRYKAFKESPSRLAKSRLKENLKSIEVSKPKTQKRGTNE